MRIMKSILTFFINLHHDHDINFNQFYFFLNFNLHHDHEINFNQFSISHLLMCSNNHLCRFQLYLLVQYCIFLLFSYSALLVAAKVLRLENLDVLLHVVNLCLTVVLHHLMRNVHVRENSEGVILYAINQGLVAKMHQHIVN